jgi:hypothetical protein
MKRSSPRIIWRLQRWSVCDLLGWSCLPHVFVQNAVSQNSNSPYGTPEIWESSGVTKILLDSNTRGMQNCRDIQFKFDTKLQNWTNFFEYWYSRSRKKRKKATPTATPHTTHNTDDTTLHEPWTGHSFGLLTNINLQLVVCARGSKRNFCVLCSPCVRVCLVHVCALLCACVLYILWCCVLCAVLLAAV